MKLFRSVVMFALLVTAGAARLDAGLIVDQQPHNFGGPAADSAYVSFGDLRWQEPADDFVLSQPAIVNRIDWWGFYGSNFLEGARPPNGKEEMRIRIYDSRASDGLPGVIIREESHVNSERILTGRTVWVANGYPERKYRVNLINPIALGAGTTYWLSISQVGAPESTFRWEFSQSPSTPDFAFRAIFTSDWELAGLTSGLAFQL